MASVDFSELLPEVLATVPACPVPTVLRAIRNVARDLCERSKAYRHTLANEPVVAGQRDFVLDIPTHTTLVAPISLTLNGEPLRPTSETLLDQDDPEWRTRSGTPTHFLRSNDDLDGIILYPTPDADFTEVGIRGVVAIKPSRTALEICEIFLDRYQTALIAGALGNLLMIRSPWFSPQLAAYHGSVYEGEVEKAKNYATGDDMPKRRIVRYGGI